MSEIEWTDEQLAVLGHDPTVPALVIAGPGTGKSTTVIAFARAIAADQGPKAIRLATFTRAATNELAAKLEPDPDASVPVTTLHSFALGLIRSNMQWNRLPTPIRIPDDWEADQLIHPDLRLRLKPNWPDIRKDKVRKLEREMAARFESLTQEIVIEANVDPRLREAFIAAWQRQRSVFGYSLFAEMPWYAFEMLEDHPDVDLGGLRVLVVDEYQDLNASELRLVQALSEREITVVGVGDDEQSIYSWRMAAPEGILRFESDYSPASRYELTEARRFGRLLLETSQRLIATSPNRDPKRNPMYPRDDADAGEFSYLRFENNRIESASVADLVRFYLDQGVPSEKIAVLSRSDRYGVWTKDVREGLEQHDVPLRAIEQATEPLHTREARLVMANARLLMDEGDDLAWWTLLKLEFGCSENYIRSISDSALERGERFNQRIRTLEDEPVEGTARSENAAQRAIEAVAQLREQVSHIAEDASFLELCTAIADVDRLELSDDYIDLITRVEERIRNDLLEPTLSDVLAQLEPIAEQLALEEGGVAAMTIAKSKGLTFDVVITLGVENENFSDEDPHLHEELRRLLYVAMTRARQTCHLTMSTERSAPTAFSFDGTPYYTRSRAAFLSAAGINPRDGLEYMRALGIH
jgi:DNA helicase-2/ATP-dependent DNA helicase PcrA